jgi:hypothetical protein
MTARELLAPDSGPAAVASAAFGPVEALWRAAAAHAPAMLSALALLLLLWLVARLARAVVARVLRMTPLDAVIEKTQLGKLLRAFDSGMTLSRAIASLVYVAILLMAFMSAADLLGLGAAREALGAVLGYMPRLISVVFVLAVGGFLASAARRAVGAMLRELRNPYAGSLEAVGEGALLVVSAAIAVDLLGVDISFLTANLSLVIGVGLVTLAFLGSWSMRRPAEEIIANYYLRRMVDPGDRVRLGAIEGTIEGFTPIGVVIRDAAGSEHFVPARHVLDGLSCSGRARRSRDRRAP